MRLLKKEAQRRVRCARVYKIMISPICVECGKRVESGKELFREFSGGSLQLSRCVSRVLKLNNTRRAYKTTGLLLWDPG